ncbi:MAG: hypothetical protein ACQEST_08040, partial [Bacteroidota bacterium]
LRNNLIYTFLLGFLFIGFGLSLNEADTIEFDTEDTTHWISQKHGSNQSYLTGEELNNLHFRDNNQLMEKALNQTELLILLMRLKSGKSSLPKRK